MIVSVTHQHMHCIAIVVYWMYQMDYKTLYYIWLITICFIHDWLLYVWLIRLMISLIRHWGGGQASWGGRWGESWGCQGRGEVWDHHILGAPSTPTSPRGGRDPPRGHHDGGGCHEARWGASDHPAPRGLHRGPRDSHQGRRERAKGEEPRGTHVSVKDPASKLCCIIFWCNVIWLALLQ